MKILQLLERQIQTDIKDKKYNGKLRAARSGWDETAFSTGRDDKNDPHMFKKYNHTPLSSDKIDGYDVFIRYLIDNDIENPYFPNVYNITKIDDNTGKHITTYKVEKLLKYSQVTIEDLLTILNVSFIHDEYTTNTIAAMEANIKSYEEDEWFYNSKLQDLSSMIANRVEHGLYAPSTIRSEPLKKALKILNTIRAEKSLKVDIHQENVMYRRTGKGVQLVINDPFSFKLR